MLTNCGWIYSQEHKKIGTHNRKEHDDMRRNRDIDSEQHNKHMTHCKKFCDHFQLICGPIKRVYKPCHIKSI